ncbi:MAG: thioredoxin domain-containing protein [Gemmatimonadales bacterium]
MKLREAGSSALVVVAVLCAVVTTAITIRREFFSTSAPGAVTEITNPNAKPVRVDDWQKYATGGHRIGPANAPVTIVEFAEFECPYCKALALGPLEYIRAKYPGQVSIIFRQMPMSYHRFAYPAARAAECAGMQGRFEQFHDVVFAGQDSLGLKSFDEFAAAAGVGDLTTFSLCSKGSQALPGVQADIAAGKELGVRGTPTFLVNGGMMVGVPDTTVLERLIVKALAAR